MKKFFYEKDIFIEEFKNLNIEEFKLFFKEEDYNYIYETYNYLKNKIKKENDFFDEEFNLVLNKYGKDRILKSLDNKEKISKKIEIENI